MVYSENLTNRQLLANAMPFASLSRTQWNTLLKHIEKLEDEEGESELTKTLETVFENQSKIEVMANYCFYFCNDIDKPVSDDCSKELQLFV